MKSVGEIWGELKYLMSKKTIFCENGVYSCHGIPRGRERGEEYIRKLASAKASQGVEVKKNI